MSTPTRPRRHAAGIFDVRNIIAALLGIYGIVLIVLGIVNSAQDVAKSDGVNLNLWTGVALLIFAVLMGLWAWTRPIVVDPEEPPDADQPAPPGTDWPGEHW